MDRFTRREFVAGAAGLVAGAAAVSLFPSGAPAKEPAKKLLVTCRDPFLKLAGRKDCWSAMAALGAEGVEATVRDDLSFPELFHPDRKYSVATPAGIEQLAADMKSAGGRITAICMYNRFDERPEFEIQWATKVAQAAKALGVPAVRIDVVSHKMPRAGFLDFAVATLKKVVAATEDTGVKFAIENHGNTTNDPEFLNPLFDRVGSDRLGLTLDTANFYWYGHPLAKVYGLFESLAPRAFHTHCKSIRYPAGDRDRQRPMGWEYEKHTAPIYEGDIDFRRFVEILQKAGYANDLCVENECLAKFPAAERAEVFSKELRYLKGLR